MRKDRKEKNNTNIEGNAKVIILICFAVVIPFLMFVTQQIFLDKMWDKICEEGISTVTDLVETGTKLEFVMFETGLSVISIAVSVWIGLNIYNILKKSDIDKEIKANNERLERELEKYKEERAKVEYEYHKDLFIRELEKTQYRYEISRYFKDTFKKDTEISLEDYKIFYKLEKLFYICISDYEHKRNGMESAVKFEEEIRRVYADDKQKDHYFYLSIRYSDALFYLYNALVKEKQDIERQENYLIKSNEIYEAVLKEIQIKMDDDTLGYMHNSIGWIYRLLLGFNKEQNQKWEANARKNLESAVLYNPKGRYYQNLGSDYEREKNYEKAIEQYEKALKTPNLDKKVYNLLGSGYLKIFEKKHNIENRFKDGKILKDFLSIELKPEDTKLLNEASAYLYKAKIETPELIDVYYNFGKALVYEWLFIDKRNDVEKIKKAYLQISRAKIYEPENTGVLFTLRNYYEAIEDFENAITINEQLIKMGVIGDTNNAQGVYEKRKNQSSTI